MHLSLVAISELQPHHTDFMLFTALLGYWSQLYNYCWRYVPYIVLHKTSTLGYFQGSLECEVFIQNTAMKKFTNLFEMKINSGMSYLFWECGNWQMSRSGENQWFPSPFGCKIRTDKDIFSDTRHCLFLMPDIRHQKFEVDIQIPLYGP